jgi:hypothetical protein
MWSLPIVGLSPYCVRYATEARMYSLIMLLVVAGQLLVRRALTAPGRAPLVALALVSGALLLSHYWSIWLIAATAAVLLWRWRSGDHRAPRVVAALAAGGLAFLPWLPSFLEQLDKTGTPWGSAFRPSEAAALTIADLGGFQFGEMLLLGVLLVPLLVVAVFGSRTGRHTIEVDFARLHPAIAELTVAVLALVIGATVAWLTGGTYATRYASVFVPLMLIVAAVGAARLPRAAAVTWGTLVVLVSVGGVGANLLNARTQARDVADAIEVEARQGDLAVYCPDQLGPAMARELDAPIDQVTFPELRAPERVDWVDYAERVDRADPTAFAAELDRRADGAVWFVFSGGYRTHRGQCEAVANTLAQLRGPGRARVRADAEFYESATLLRFEPRA